MGSYCPSEESIFRSKFPNIMIPGHLTLHEFCFQNMAEKSGRPCLIDYATGSSLTYAEVELLTRRVAAGLHNLGLRRGDVLLILLPNCTAFPIAFLAASRLGAASTTANPFHTPAEVAKQAKASGARLVLTEPEQLDKVLPLGLPAIVVVNDCAGTGGLPLPDGCTPFSELLSADESNLPAVDVRSEDTVTLPYSSGTTGMPKGVMLTHRGLVTSVSQQVDGDNPNMYLDTEDVILCVLPMFHIYSINTVLLCGLRCGAAIVILRKFDVAAMAEAVERYRVTFAPVVPPIVVELSKSAVVDRYDLSSVRMVMSGAAPMGKDLQETLRVMFPSATLGQGYGMTEAGPVLSLCPAFAKVPLPAKSGSCGTVVRNAELKIVDPETGHSLPRNESGEICIRGKQLMKGYLNDPEATAKTIDKDGWLHTGDIGYVDDDDEIFIVDRLKELIKYKGFQVAPAEIEAILLTNPYITDAAVVGIPDELCGEIPVAFVVRKNGSDVKEDEIKLYIKKQVVFYKRIHKVFFVEAIPKSPSGKILRKDLKARMATACNANEPCTLTRG